ncbi:MAG TPA: TraB/GumN family protein [Flavobacteriaceae bacterium]|nr:TraB/GumN family protein [Flavobacteriaceae bacterium]
MQKSILSFLRKFSVVFIFFSLIINLQAQEEATPKMAWEVTSPQGETAYFIGSVHMVKPELYPLDSVYYQLLEKADVVGFEVNMDSLLIQSQTLLPKYGLYPMGETLKDHLSEKTFIKLEKHMDSLGVPLAMMLQMKPWVVASSLTALGLQKAGYSSQGIDQHFFTKAKDANKEIIGLETTEFQMRIFADMTDEEQVDFLEYSLDHAKEGIDSIDEIMELWKKGDSENLNKLMEGGMEEFSPEVYQDLIINRNKNWVPEIEKLLKEGKTPLIIVGVGHLVGENSVNNLLIEEGYQVKQLH